MMKIRLLFLLLFLFTFQNSFSSSHNADEFSFFVSEETENQTQYERNNFIQNMFGEVFNAQFVGTGIIQDKQCILPNYKPNEFQVSVIKSDLKSSAEMDTAFLNANPSNRIVNVPIYLQTGKIRL